MNQILFISFLFVLHISSKMVVPVDYPLYKQCGQSWSNCTMGGNNDTLCAVGCIVTSISSALYGHYYMVDGTPSNPGTLNAWLKQHGGYAYNSGLNQSIITEINPEKIQWKGEVQNLTRSEIISALNSTTTAVIAHVLHGTDPYPHHFVLVSGWDTDNENIYYVRDSFYNNTYYNITQVTDWRIYDMQFMKPYIEQYFNIIKGIQ